MDLESHGTSILLMMIVLFLVYLSNSGKLASIKATIQGNVYVPGNSKTWGGVGVPPGTTIPSVPQLPDVTGGG